jgi:hypothetical protein
VKMQCLPVDCMCVVIWPSCRFAVLPAALQARVAGGRWGRSQLDGLHGLGALGQRCKGRGTAASSKVGAQ